MSEDHYLWSDRRNNKARAVVRSTLAPINPGTATSSSINYALKGLSNEAEIVRSTPKGERNHRLNVAAYKLGGLIAAGLLEREAVWAQLEAAGLDCGLDAGEVFRTLRSGLGAGEKLPRHVEELTPIAANVTEVSAAEITSGTNGHHIIPDLAAAAVRTSWWPIPVAEAAENAKSGLKPCHLLRDDGAALFYPGKVNGLIGESESGKSWVQQWTIVQAVQLGQRVLLLDFEDSAAGIHERMRLLGCTEEQLELLDYANPSEALGIAQTEDLAEALREYGYALIGVDGVNAAMTLLGYDINDNGDATLFNRKLLKPLADTGATVLGVDHVPKNAEARGKGGIGAQAKRAMMDGCCLRVEVLEQFGKGQDGKLRLVVDKDRPGAVRGISGNSSHAGNVSIISREDSVKVRVMAPDLRAAEEKAEAGPTYTMGLVSDALELLPAGSTLNAVFDAVKGRRVVIRDAVMALARRGYVRLDSGRNRSTIPVLVRPYRESEDPLTGLGASVRPSASAVRPGITESSASVRPMSLDGTHWTHTDKPNMDKAVRPPDALPPAADNGTSDCNRCGEPTEDSVIDSTGGYCRRCAGREFR